MLVETLRRLSCPFTYFALIWEPTAFAPTFGNAVVKGARSTFGRARIRISAMYISKIGKTSFESVDEQDRIINETKGKE